MRVCSKITDAITPLRVREMQKELGLDFSQHGEFVARVETAENPIQLRQRALAETPTRSGQDRVSTSHELAGSEF